MEAAQDFRAALRTKLERFAWELERHRATGERYRQRLVNVPGVRPDRDCVRAQFTVFADDRRAVRAALRTMEFVPWKTFGRIIARHQGDAGVRTLGCADVFSVMAFAELTWRESLRDIEVCLTANQARLFHI